MMEGATVVETHEQWLHLVESDPVGLLAEDGCVVIRDGFTCAYLKNRGFAQLQLEDHSLKALLRQVFGAHLPADVLRLPRHEELVTFAEQLPLEEGEPFDHWFERLLQGRVFPVLDSPVLAADFVLALLHAQGKFASQWVDRLLARKELEDFGDFQELFLPLVEKGVSEITHFLTQTWKLPFEEETVALTRKTLDFRRTLFQKIAADPVFGGKSLLNPSKVLRPMEKWIARRGNGLGLDHALKVYTGFFPVQERQFLLKALDSSRREGKALLFEQQQMLSQTLGLAWLDLQGVFGQVHDFPSLKWDTLQAWLRAYMDEYKRARLVNQPETCRERTREFGEWFKDQQGTFSTVHARRTLATVRERVQALLDKGEKVLVYVVDALGSEWMEFLESRIRASARLVQSQLLLSTVPTTTQPNRELMLGNAGWEKTMARSSDGSLESFLKEERQLYVYWDLSYDAERVHAAFDDGEALYFEQLETVDRLVGELLRVIRWFGGYILLLADHGNTVFPGSILPAIYGERDHSGRVLRCGRREGEALLANNPEMLLVPDGEDHVLVVPLGHGTFGKRPHGAMHGGVTPEEMAVPYLLVAPEDAEVRPPELELRAANQPRKRKGETVELEIRNHSDMGVVIKRLSGRFITGGVHDLEIRPGEKLVVPVQADLSEMRGVQFELGLRVQVHYRQHSYSWDEALEVKTTGPGASTGLEDLF